MSPAGPLNSAGGTAPIWTPGPARAAATAMARFAAAAGARSGLDLSAYADLHAWSVRDLGAFWGSVADFCGLGLGGGEVLADPRMPGASWFPGARVNRTGAAVSRPSSAAACRGCAPPRYA